MRTTTVSSASPGTIQGHGGAALGCRDRARRVRGARSQLAAAQPNILWIMADDLGWGEPGTTRSVASPHGRLAAISVHRDRLFGEEGLVVHALRTQAAHGARAVRAPALFTGA